MRRWWYTEVEIETFRENSNKYVINQPEVEGAVANKPNIFSKVASVCKNFTKTNSLKIILPLILLVIIIYIYYSLFNDGKKTTNSTIDNYTSCLEYCRVLEEKLCNVLGNIEGVGNVNVMVTLESGPELKIATQVDERTTSSTNSSGTNTSVTVVEEPIIITQNGEDKPLVLMEILPVIKGVVVVAEGAKDVATRLNILEAVQALLGISNSNIQILIGV